MRVPEIEEGLMKSVRDRNDRQCCNKILIVCNKLHCIMYVYIITTRQTIIVRMIVVNERFLRGFL